ncbi:DsbA family protein [Sphingobium nicotianae]|uniref:Thioredoxin domain-containing protein n=1 Tax=Sphingobium nicotianae TaxID=2782607 RepID=A0A9X1D9V8_9SPHN|nr:thioredoxin domain-containing protein [Sphingobium nicotianae]MBT2185973.1 thioredoxin domain-containing protein [Sphingobium nicotianae]
MIRRILFALAALTVLTAPATAQKKAATPNWAATVTPGANGAYVIGNPKAQRLIEYLSYTCPHCGAFHKEGLVGPGGLRTQWLRRGLVSLEVRNFVRDPFDLTAAMLARCGGPARFAANHEALFNNQEAWFKVLQPFSEAEGAKLPADQVAAMTLIADKTGLFALLARQGLTPAAQRACLADKQALANVLAMTAGSWDVKGFDGTPYFVLNGKSLPDVHTWAALRPLLPPLPAAGK